MWPILSDDKITMLSLSNTQNKQNHPHSRLSLNRIAKQSRLIVLLLRGRFGLGLAILALLGGGGGVRRRRLTLGLVRGSCRRGVVLLNSSSTRYCAGGRSFARRLLLLFLEHFRRCGASCNVSYSRVGSPDWLEVGVHCASVRSMLTGRPH